MSHLRTHTCRTLTNLLPHAFSPKCALKVVVCEHRASMSMIKNISMAIHHMKSLNWLAFNQRQVPLSDSKQSLSISEFHYNDQARKVRCPTCVLSHQHVVRISIESVTETEAGMPWNYRIVRTSNSIPCASETQRNRMTLIINIFVSWQVHRQV